jgi:hypothetical protein
VLHFRVLSLARLIVVKDQLNRPKDQAMLVLLRATLDELKGLDSSGASFTSTHPTKSQPTLAPFSVARLVEEFRTAAGQMPAADL